MFREKTIPRPSRLRSHDQQGARPDIEESTSTFASELLQVGLALRTAPFGHGQLYVAASRVSTWDGLRVWQNGEMDMTEDGNKFHRVRNVVYQSVLRDYDDDFD